MDLGILRCYFGAFVAVANLLTVSTMLSFAGQWFAPYHCGDLKIRMGFCDRVKSITTNVARRTRARSRIS
jgi:hypothetical protein